MVSLFTYQEGVISKGGRVGLGGGTQDKKMSKGHLPRVVSHQVYNEYQDKHAKMITGAIAMRNNVSCQETLFEKGSLNLAF